MEPNRSKRLKIVILNHCYLCKLARLEPNRLLGV